MFQVIGSNLQTVNTTWNITVVLDPKKASKCPPVGRTNAEEEAFERNRSNFKTK
jgi:hypothetical protein